MVWARRSGQRGLVERLELALLGGGYGFRDLLEAFEFGAMQKFADVEQDNKTAFQLAHADDVAGLAIGKHRAGRFDFRRRNLQHLGGGIYDQADQLVVEFDDENAVLLVRMNFRLAETLAEIHYRDDLPAQVDYALDQIGSARNA